MSLPERTSIYTCTNYKTKKALKEAAAFGKQKGFYQPGPFGGNKPRDGVVYLEGPHYPAAHTWYAQATVKDGIILTVK